MAAAGPIEGLAELGAARSCVAGDGAMRETVAEQAPFKSDEGLDIACL